ncbi:MFS general substrate transporter [Vararia minispora EC-137]|uniref:MFS general substrate transporter n=1 Tax=Vararia minispora EC-137 TaxID=1314806 RepID=A0ACB8QUQ3_9AGAM|nr:MFS general substrate transporter [Vararia minispora EC-137]
MATTENTPLLGQIEERIQHDHDTVYERFSPAHKRLIVTLVSLAGFMQMFVAGSFVPSVLPIARELGTTGAVINLAVSLSVLTAALGMLFWARYAGFYGRRPIYLCMHPILVLGSLGVAQASSVPELMAFRVLQAFGGCGGFSIGAGVIGDIYRLEERGRAMGIFFAACFLSPALAPMIGGLVAHYASWRVMQLCLAISAVCLFCGMYTWLPETSQPRARGIDKLLEGEGAGSEKQWRWVWLNPFSDLALLRSPNLLAVCLSATTVLLSDFLLLNPLAFTIGKQYGITNEGIIGLFFLPAGLGNMIGAPLAGRISDRVIVEWRRKRGGVWVPEDRLRASVLGMAVIVPVSLLACGFCTEYVPGTPGIVLNLFFLFMNGVGIDYAMTPMSAYSVDIMHSRSAEVIAATAGLRNIICGSAVSGFLPTIDRIGVFATDAIVAVLVWFFLGILLLTIKYGDRMRAWVDVGYSTPATN